jgi:hypothetical protein
MENGHILDGVDDDLGESSSGSSSIKHTAAAIKENGQNSTATVFGI